MRSQRFFPWLKGAALLGFGLTCIAEAADFYQVATTATVKIEEHGQCRNVTNNNALSLFVPTRTSTEFTSFIGGHPPWVNSTLCCPTGYSFVPGNGTYGTGDFCIMRFEAKDVGGVPTSQAALSPWINISMYEARRKCQALGIGYDLTTNNHYQTAARNIEGVATNWSGGAVGSGCLFMGNSGGVDACRYNGASSPTFDFGSSRDPKALLRFSSGDTIYDLSGNAMEIVQGDDGVNLTFGGMGAIDLTGSPKQWYGPAGTYASCSGDPTGYCGMGWSNYGGAAVYAIMRGADNTDGAGGGLFWSHTANYWKSAGGAHGGFRCIYDPARPVSTCNGVSVGGFCWYLGNTTETCTSVCTHNGGYNSATLSYAGSGGSDANCQAVLDALKAPGSGAASTTATATGCHVNGTTRRRGTTSTTAGASASVYRACACNN